MAGRGTYNGGSTIIGWSRAITSSTKKKRVGRGLLAAEAREKRESSVRSDLMPPTDPIVDEPELPATLSAEEIADRLSGLGRIKR